jgi:hypothetical protein
MKKFFSDSMSYAGALLLAMVLSGCATTSKYDYSKFREANPKSILVVPVTNRTVDVDAPDYFLSTITIPLAERGFYVFPVNAVKKLMEDNGLSDADMVKAADPTRLGDLFKADAILYMTIENWNAQYIVLSTTVTVSISYVLKSAKTGEMLWQGSSTCQYNSGGGGGGVAGLVVMAVSAAVTKAAPNYMPLARQTNEQLVPTEHIGLPAGPYHDDYNKDQKKF